MKRSLFVALLFLSLLAAPQFSEAQSSAGAGVGIVPALIEKSVEPGSSLTERIEVSNLSGSDQIYYLFTRDIVGVEGGGTPIFAEENQEKTGFEMSDWVSLSVTELPIPANGKGAVDVTINVPDHATPGSHFAGVFVSMEPPKMRSVGAAVAYQVANIVSIRVAGDAVESAEIRQFSTGNYIYGESTVDFHARVENKGSVLVRPIGPLEVYNMFGKRVALLTFNESRAGVFPGTTRDLAPVIWEDEGPGFGRYKAVLALAYGEQGRQATVASTATFWILPKNILLPAIGILAFLLVTSYISVKLYVRRKLQMTSMQSRRIVRRRRGGGGMSALMLVVIVMLVVTSLFLLLLLALFA